MDLAGIRTRGVCKMNHYDCTGTSLEKGDYAVVMTERGPILGEVVQRLDSVSLATEKASFPKVVRPASADDLRAHQENAKREADAHMFCQSRIEARKLPMKLVRTETLLDRSKMTFYFTADGRIDFRELVKDLAHEMRTRIEMRQVGVRDEARMVGGVPGETLRRVRTADVLPHLRARFVRPEQGMRDMCRGRGRSDSPFRRGNGGPLFPVRRRGGELMGGGRERLSTRAPGLQSAVPEEAVRREGRCAPSGEAPCRGVPPGGTVREGNEAGGDAAALECRDLREWCYGGR
jgi:hypothetical protein